MSSAVVAPIEINFIASGPGRPRKYHTEEQKAEARRAYMKTHKERKKAGAIAPSKRGRPKKYHTEEEKLEARKRYNQTFLERRQAGLPIAKGRGRPRKYCAENYDPIEARKQSQKVYYDKQMKMRREQAQEQREAEEALEAEKVVG